MCTHRRTINLLLPHSLRAWLSFIFRQKIPFLLQTRPAFSTFHAIRRRMSPLHLLHALSSEGDREEAREKESFLWISLWKCAEGKFGNPSFGRNACPHVYKQLLDVSQGGSRIFRHAPPLHETKRVFLCRLNSSSLLLNPVEGCNIYIEREGEKEGGREREIEREEDREREG